MTRTVHLYTIQSPTLTFNVHSIGRILSKNNINMKKDEWVTVSRTHLTLVVCFVTITWAGSRKRNATLFCCLLLVQIIYKNLLQCLCLNQRTKTFDATCTNRDGSRGLSNIYKWFKGIYKCSLCRELERKTICFSMTTYVICQIFTNVSTLFLSEAEWIRQEIF